MSQMSSKIWLHKDTKYSTGDIVCGYQYDFVQGIEDEGGIENFVEYVPANAFIEKAERYIRSIADGLDRDDDVEAFISEFRNYMKGE